MKIYKYESKNFKVLTSFPIFLYLVIIISINLKNDIRTVNSLDVDYLSYPFMIILYLIKIKAKRER